MKQSFCVAFFTFFAIFAYSQKPLVIKGSFSKIPTDEKLFINYRVGEDFAKDSSSIKNGKFSFSIKLAEPGIVYIVRKAAPNAKQRDMLEVFASLNPITINAVDSLATAKVVGSKLHNDFVAMKNMAKPTETKLVALYDDYGTAYNKKDTAKMKLLDKQIESLQNNELFEAYKNFIVKNKNSAVALHALEKAAGYDINVPKVEPLWNMLPTTLQKTKKGEVFAGKLAIAAKTQIGKQAIEFVQNDTTGKPVNLTDFRGKYVLIDFWASWCGPCRKENPNVVKAYNTYKDKQFTVLGVSLDRDKGKWINAIKDDSLTWTHVSDLKFWKNEVAEQYGIQAIPQNILVGPDGVIVAKNLREEGLWDELKKIFEK